MNVVDFGMIVEINKMLKEKGINYSVHSIGGCASCGLSLKQEGESCSTDKIIQLINSYLKQHWLKVEMKENILIVESLFHQ